MKMLLCKKEESAYNKSKNKKGTIMKTLKKIAILTLSAFLIFNLTACSKDSETEERKRFDQFIETEFIEEMEDDYITMHVFLENPESFGVDESRVKRQIMGEVDNYEAVIKELKEKEKEWSAFEREHLNSYQQETYDIYDYTFQLAKAMSDSKFEYLGSAFETMGGMHTQLPALFSDWTLRNEQDVQDLIAIVKDTAPTFDKLLSYTKKQAEKGLLMVNTKDIIEYCEKITNQGMNSSVLSAMNAGIDAIDMDIEKKEEYKKQLAEVFASSFLKGYQNVIDAMKMLKNEKNNVKGLAHLKNGKEYYELLLQSSVGSMKSVNEIKELLDQCAKKYLGNMQRIALNNSEALQTMYEKDPKTKYTDFSEMLDDLKQWMKKDFPEIKEVDYQIAAINPEIASEGIAAYFNLPALDATTPKQIRVNTKGDALDVQDVTTFATIAHEGFPGHMYQNAYVYENMKNSYRKVGAQCKAYQEGYATYIQFYAYQYLDMDKDVLELLKANEIYINCKVARADIGIHYDGWDFKEFKRYLTQSGLGGIKDADIMDLYSQLRDNPAAFAPYYVGFAEFDALKEEAETQLLNQFDDKKFHQALLKSGTAPFHVVKRNVNDYIQKNR